MQLRYYLCLKSFCYVNRIRKYVILTSLRRNTDSGECYLLRCWNAVFWEVPWSDKRQHVGDSSFLSFIWSLMVIHTKCTYTIQAYGRDATCLYLSTSLHNGTLISSQAPAVWNQAQILIASLMVWNKCRNTGGCFWGVFLKSRREPFLHILNPGRWSNGWCCSSHLGLWGDLENERQMAEEKNGSSLRPCHVELSYLPWPAYHLTEFLERSKPVLFYVIVTCSEMKWYKCSAVTSEVRTSLNEFIMW